MTASTRDANALLVEFLGAAGVGKSFLLAQLREELKSRGIVAKDFTAITIRRFSPPGVLAVLRSMWLALVIQPTSLVAYFNTVKTLSAYAIRRRVVMKKRGIYLYSEGLFHRIRRYHRSSKGMPMNLMAERLFRHILPPDVVVVVEAREATILSRRTLRARPGDSFSRESVQQDVLLVEDSVAAIGCVQRKIAPNLRVIRADVDGQRAEVVAKRIADVLEHTLM